ncbi:hypothetical protein PHYPSEUDO_007168 [Phytophthora pseudosyringae]|uniref:Uncharacterized protein n=1 Tax=Phytophthora pseudosyringae TaxID=221518 RepID=A0A8T1VHS0_9STRA|nr:hypothetical protein PHYPSEUDO_007168 [Phytophthora pseudosyringae]
MEDKLRQVEEMERGMHWKPVTDIQFGRYKPPGVNPGPMTRDNPGAKAPTAYVAATSREYRELSSDELQWEDEDDEDSGYQYDEEDNDYDVQSSCQEYAFRADDLRGFAPWNDPEPRKIHSTRPGACFEFSTVRRVRSPGTSEGKMLETHDV